MSFIMATREETFIHTAQCSPLMKLSFDYFNIVDIHMISSESIIIYSPLNDVKYVALLSCIPF